MTPRRGGLRWALAVLALCALAAGAEAATRITLSGPAAAGPIDPDADGRFSFPNVPLRRNAVNAFTVTATDDLGQTLRREVRITQLSLDAIVVSRVTAEPLSVQQVEQLVQDGVIKLDDPNNFNVSQFNIVLTIGREVVPVSVPIVLGEADATGSEVYRIPSGGSGGGRPRIEPVEIVVFDVAVPASLALPQPPRIPGVIVIEGRIKSLKEFYSVRLLLMNTSGIFTLRDVRAQVEFPTGGLSSTLPADGIAAFGDILPGTPEQPGQAEREFIVRGDEIGVRPVKVSFGGRIGGPGIPEDAQVPFNGSAQATVEVKGPPAFLVQVKHPPAVVAGVPYELTVDIANTGEMPALYASLELSVGADAELVTCTVDAAGAPTCEPVEGPSVRHFGHIFPGKTVSETFTVLPHVTGVISSCLGVADQNISLQVFVGNLNCLVGQFPPSVGVPTGIPTVTVLPLNNTLAVGIDSPVTAFFSKLMNTATITQGAGGTFRVIDDQGQTPPGRIRFVTLNDKTVAIWQLEDGITNRLIGNAEYSVLLSQEIRDLQGNALANSWSSRFTTTSPTDDQDPPTLTLSAEPPVDVNRVLPGQSVRLNAYAADQGTGVARVELRRQDADTANAPFELVDQKTVFATSSGPCIFTIDSSKLSPGRTYQFKATAYDRAGNGQEATIAVIVAASAAAPTIRLPADPAQPTPRGIFVTLAPAEVSPGVRTVHYYLDGAGLPIRTVTLAPFQTSLSTIDLAPGPHTVRAVAVDGLDQTGEDSLTFVVDANTTRPVVNFGTAVDGAQYLTGAVFSVAATATDPAGIQSVDFYLNAVGGTQIASGLAPFTVSTVGLAAGPHRVIIVAVNRLGVANDVADPASVLDFVVVNATSGPPPAAPTLNPLGPPANGVVTVGGTAPPGARVTITNVTLGLTLSVFAGATGAFSAVIDAAAGNVIQAVVVDLAQSPTPSPPASASVPAPVALSRIEVSPAAFTLTAVNAVQDLSVIAFYANGTSADVTTQATYASSNLAAASVGATGRVVALAAGAATITAQFGGQQAQAAVSVNVRTLVSIAIDPSPLTIVGVGQTRQLAVVGTYADATTGPITAGITFSTSAPAVALVNATGLVTSTGFGSATVTAAMSGVPPARTVVTVSALGVTGIGVTPSSILFTIAGETRSLQVTRSLSDGSTEPAPPPITYQSSDTDVATVNAVGLVTAVGSGSATITVRHAGFEATVPVAVDIPVAVHPPDITELDRPRAAEGDLFVIRGHYFAALPAQNHVSLNGVTAQVQSARQDELSVLVPAGATTGPVTVQVGAFTSNAATLGVYARGARSLPVTGAVDVPATPGQKLTLTLPGIDLGAGDVALLSSAPDLPAPLSFMGTLRARVDTGSFSTVAPSPADVPDLTSLFTAGTHTLALELSESGGRIRTGPIYLLVGPDGTGTIAGDRSVIGLAQSLPVTVTFIDLPYADGAKVAVTTQQIGVSFPDGACCVNSAAGTIVNGEGTSGNDSRFRYFTVQGGRVEILYDPSSAGGFATGTGSVARLQLLPADAGGNRVGFQAAAVEEVALTSYDTVSAARTQSAVIADGTPKLVTVSLTGFRDAGGNPVPDGARVAVTVLQIGVSSPDGTCCVNSVGGTIVNGAGVAPNDSRFRYFTIQGGKVDVSYDPGAVLLAVGDVRIANLQVLPADPAGNRIGFRAFSVVPITLSSPSASAVGIGVAPASALSDSADRRVLVSVTNIVDAAGNPVPDGTTVAVTTLQVGLSFPDGTCCINSAGGSIINGLGISPNDARFSHLTVQGGQVQIVYSTSGAAVLETRQSATARVQILPAEPSGNRIGFRAFAVADVTLTGYQTAEVTVMPPVVVADGLSEVAVTLTGIRDAQGNLVPDGAKVAVTALQVGVSFPDGTCCINSSGGSITSGEGTSGNDSRFRYFTVQGGQVTVRYDSASILLGAGEIATANVQVLPATPTGNRIGFRAFAVAAITLSSVSAQPTGITVTPPSVLADGADTRVTVTVRDIADALGNRVPDGTTVAVATQQIGVAFPDGACCVNSAGGSIINGQGASPNDSRFVYLTVQGGQVEVVYRSGAVRLEAGQTATARVQVLPATPSGSRIGFRAFAVPAVSLAGYQSADVSGAGALTPGGVATYTVGNIRDTSGNLVPDGSRIGVTAMQIGVAAPDGSCCVNSVGGTIQNGGGNLVNDSRLRSFTVQNGAISIQFQAPAGAGTSVLQLLPADVDGNRVGFRALAIKSISVSP